MDEDDSTHTPTAEDLVLQRQILTLESTATELVHSSLTADSPKASHLYLAASVMDLHHKNLMIKDARDSLYDEAGYIKTMRTKWEADLSAKDEEIKGLNTELAALRAAFEAFKKQMEAFKVSRHLTM